MARKKISNSAQEEVQPESATTTQPPPKKATKARPKAEAAKTPAKAPAKEKAKSPAKGSAVRASVPGTEAAPKPQKPLRQRAAKSKAKSETASEEMAAQEPAAKAARGRKRSTEEAAPPVSSSLMELDLPQVTFKARSTVEPPARTSAEAKSGDRKGRRGRAQAKAPAEGVELPAAPLEPFAFESDEPDMPLAHFRGAKAAAAASETPSDEPSSESGPNLAPRRTSRRQRGADREPRGRESAAAEDAPRKAGRAAPAPEPEPEPAPPPIPVKPIIHPPADAPQIVLQNGAPTLVRNGRVYPSIAFFGSTPDERRAETVLGEIRMAADAGIHVHFLLVEFEVDQRAVKPAVSFAAYMLNKIVEIDPEAQVVFRVVFGSPKGWENRYPEAVYRDQTGRIADPSVCDEDFWAEAEQGLAEFVRQLRLLPNEDHILGLQLERGEWFLPEDSGYDDSRAAVKGFRKWARTRYLNDVVALRAAWFEGTVNFDTLSIPAFHRPFEEGEKFMRVSRKERRWVDYHLFLSDATAQLISNLAYTVKEASEGYFIVGVSYGYTFEWSHPYSGHLSLGKLLRTPEIDFIAGPPSYRNREPKGAAPFPSPIDSFPLSGKLYVSEEDFKTSIGTSTEPDDFNPTIKTPQALESVHWRGVGAALAHSSGVCWMDLWGNGWLKTHTIWSRGAKARELLTRRMAAPISDPDVAVFIDERALAYLIDQNSFALLVQNVRESVLRAGMSAGFYLLSDLAHREKFPETRLNIFVNAWDMRPEHRAAIKNRLQNDGKLLFWLYCGGLFDAGREALERAREVTGIAIKPQPFHSRTGTTILQRRHPLCEAFPDVQSIGGGKLEPSYFAIPEEATVLGEYTQTGLPSFVIRELKEEGNKGAEWKSVFLGEPVVSPALIRALGQLAGAHIFNYQDDVVHVRPPFLTLHSVGGGPRAIMLPNGWSAYDVLSGEWATIDSTNLRFQTLDGSTHVFLVGLRHEIEAMLAADIDDLCRIAQLPQRDDNTVRQDVAALDVPIVQLDEFIEGAGIEEVSDEWLLRPKFVEADETETEAIPVERDGKPVGRRRRRQRRSGKAEANGEPAATFGELGMNVLFRKRN